MPGKISPAAEQALNVAENDFFPLILATLGWVLVVSVLRYLRQAEPATAAPAASPT